MTRIVLTALDTKRSGVGAVHDALRIFVIFVATGPGASDCTIIPSFSYSVDKSLENLSTNA